MIHELIDPKKKTGKSSATTNTKTLDENCAFEQSDNETVKEPDSASTTFIPPWLRNSLGLIQRHNQSHATFDQKSAKIIPRFKEENHNEFESLKKNPEQGSCTKVSDHLEILPNESGGEGADGVESCFDNGEKQMAVFWSTRQKESETESTCTNAELKILRREDLKMTNTDVRTSAEIGKLKDEERRRLKFIKQRNKIRKRIMSEHRTGYPRKNEVDFLLEMKARQVLDDYMRKEVHSVPSDTKLLEAKLILLSGKCRDVDNSPLTQQEILLLQEIKEKAGNKEEFEKLMEHVRESNLKEIMRSSESLTKALAEKARKCEDKEEKTVKDGAVQNKYEDAKSNADRDSLISTDDENDIKRFSEFLSKNKNMDEKRKCLEEVRNYFERKRRTRLTKRRHMDEAKTPRQINSRDEPAKDRPKTKEICTMTLGREKKSKFGLCDEGIVEKAVSETLQKFVDLYHFHISPTVMGSMRRNILQALQSDSLDCSNSRHNLPGLGEFKLLEGKRTEKLGLVKEDALLDVGEESERKDQLICDFTDPDILMSKSVLSNLRDIRRKTFKTLMESSGAEQGNKPDRESEIMENESMKRLKKELESFSNSIQARADIAKLRLQSIILKRDDHGCLSKSMQCVYNFAKKALEFHKADIEAGEHAPRAAPETKTKKDCEIQTIQECETVKKNVKSQTSDIFELCEKSLQTEEKTCVARDVQTESDKVAVTEVGGVSLCPGLYRVLRSRENGRCYLHPEKVEGGSKSEIDVGKSASSALKVSDSDSRAKFLTREKTSKERRIILREKERGRGRKSKKAYLLGSSQSRRVTRKEAHNSKIFNNSISCLFFRNFSNHNASNCFSEGPAQRELEFNKESTAKEVEYSPQENHAGCAWFWNGKKITAGFDFKNHVEDLLKEKLKEIESNSERQVSANESLRTEVCLPKNEGSPGENCQAVPNKDCGRNLEIKNTNATICLRTSLDSQEEATLFTSAAETGRPEFNDKTLPNEGPINKEEANEETVSFKEGKSVRDASTQNSQQTFLSLNLTKANSRSKTSSMDKISKSEHRRGKLSVKPLRDANLKKTSDIMKAVRGLKRMKIEADENTVESGSTFEDSLPSSVSKSYEDPPTLVAGLKNKGEVAALDAKDKINSSNGAVDRECQTKDASDYEAEKWNEAQAQGPDVEDCKHWELIESVLSRVNQKERQSLWNDLRQFIKTKIGRDINDEGAKEVCIEIEQDMPKTGKGKSKHAVQARGHYTRNEGDVEVEIDLTLDDLENILRRRQRRNRRRQICRGGKTRRHISSSSGQSDFTRADLRSPFIRPKLGKLHEASCMFCQQAPGHHELKEACKSFEKVLVQNIQYGLSPSLTTAVASVPRWRLIQAAFPYVMHCTATLLHNRKDTNMQNLGATETKMLYTLHWILLVAAEECADADHENGIFQTSPFYYLFSVPAITLFIYLFAPIYHHLKESDFQTYRLENGLKMWQALWDYRHPDTPCFTAHVKPKPRMLWNRFIKGSHLQFGDVFMGRQQSSDEGLINGESPQSQSASASYCSDQYVGIPAQINVRVEPAKGTDEEGNWVSSPKDTVFPETIPEESSSTEEEHVVIFRLPSLTESEGVEKPGSLYTADPSLFHVSMARNISLRSTLTIEQVTALSGSDVRQGKFRPPPIQKMGSSTDKESVSSKGQLDSAPKVHNVSMHSSDVCAATFLDVAVLRCLFMSQWPEEGVYWALQFYYHRLREISEETNTQQLPRRRSNSLPIPKIEISLYQSPEMKKKDSNKDFIEVPEVKDVARLTESPYFGWKQSEESVSHARRASEKSTTTKRKMKITDLRTFVETKLLSKSERTLEKIGTEDHKPFFLQQEYHHSLDTGEDHLSRPSSALAKIFEHRADFKPSGWGNLVKGKSMPSLSCLTDEGSTKGYIGDQDKHMKGGRMLGAHSHTITNPIITVTEHTPTPSPDFLKRQTSVESQPDENSLQSKQQLFSQERKLSLTRSQTDSNITYACEDFPEAPGASHYITKDGDIDIQVVLKAVHSAALRDNICCTLRVCEVIFNLLELLMDMGVLKQGSSRSGSGNLGGTKSTGGKEDKESYHSSNEEIKEEYSTVKSLHEKHYTAHDLVLNSVLRVYKHLGCPHGCGDGQRGPPADFIRSQGQTILSKLQRSNPKQFSKFLRNFVRNQSLPEILEFFHAYVGFCVDPSSLLSPLNQKRSSSKSPEMVSQGGYSTNFGAGLKGGGSRGVEGQIMTSIFKTLVTRLVKSLKELKTQENVPLYCDVRQLMTYIKEAHGGVFRRVALSGLIDSASRSNKKQDPVQTARVVRHVSHSETEEQPEVPGSSFYLDEKGQKKLLFKKRSTSSACAGTLDTEGSEEGGKSQSPLGNVKKKHQPMLTPRQSEKNLRISDVNKPVKGDKASKLIPKIGSLVSWLKKEHGRSESTDSHEENDVLAEGGTLTRQQSVLHQPALGKSFSKGSSGDLKQTLQKTRKRVEDQIKKNFGFRKGKRKDGSLEETSGTYTSRKSSLDCGDSSREADYVILRERKLVPLLPVLNGMMRFSFLLETCQPGSVPDHHLLAAILDLPHAPVVSRASLLLECAYFVHNCNKGQWPTWMKLNFPMFRPSVPNQARGNNSGMRRTHILQRSSGKLFYQWAEAISNRLEEMLHKDRLHIPDVVSMVTEENRQKELLVDDEEEDFLDEASVNFCGNECPIALRMIACILLLEITAFLRETYQALPKSCRASARDRPPPWERMYSKEANRRWSMALSSMGHSQTSAQSLQSIAGDKDGGVQAERKISFVLHEPDNESEGSSNTTVTMQGEEAEEKDKKKANRTSSSCQPQGRPFLLRRGTATNATGSFKRRSLKLRRGTKEGIKEPDCDFKRTDSIQSKRKVSSLSDRSDTSEPGAAEVSGEESPGILSDDQPPESPSDSNETDDTSKNMPWMKVVVQFAHSFNFYCSHQSFCHPFCYRRHMRACERLMKAVRKVYGEENHLIKAMEEDVGKKQHDNKKEKFGRGRKVSDQTSIQASPVRRKDSFGKREKIDGGRQKDTEVDVEKNKVLDGSGKKRTMPEKAKETLPILKYLKTQVKNIFHAPLSVLVKGAVVLTEDQFIDIIPVAWELLLESDQEVAATAASLFILCSIRAPNHVSDLMHHALSNQETSVRINAILRFQVLWKLRYQVWPRMEEGAHVTFKVPPPGIEFTLPSPKIGIESLPVVDPPWVPQVQTKVEEVTISQESHRALVTATKTRKKQQTELITMALQAQEDKKRVERENFLITTIPVTVQAAYQPSLYHAVGDDHDEGDEDQGDMNQGRNTMHHTNAVHSLFPSCLCSAVIQIISLLDDAAVSSDGNAVYEVAYSVIWNCLVEDSALFLRYILERITREKQDQMFKILRHLIRFVPKLPQQAAFALYNYIIGYVMFYVRSSHEEGQQYIGTALSILWMVVHSVHGIMFKDLKQILRKEQCDASILLTANVPSAKKIIVHGPQEQDAAGIPSQFPVQEDTQFCQILRESLDFFGVDEARHKEYFLVDYKTRQIHNPSSYVRDFYFFKRSQYPQLELVYMKPEDAFNGLQRQELIHKFVEIGKVLLTWAILKNVDMVVQRVVFLHEELMKLPSFPRKALEADLDLYKKGELGKELLGLDVLHKFMWVRLIARMFEAMAGNFAYSGDIHLLLNVLNGALILHSEDSCILRYVMATYINAAHNFKNIFSTNGYLLIMPTLLQIYSNHQTNKLVTRTVEYCVKQFYLMNRKPFILQMFGSLSAILDTEGEGHYGDAHKVQAKCLFHLLLSLETPSPDPLNIGELVKEEKPLKAIDFCYHDESEMVTVLDCISLCIMVIAYASDSVRGHQMLIILEAILPYYLQQIQKPSYEKDGKTEKEIIQQLAVAIRTLVHNCEALAKNYNGPQRSSPEHKGSSQRNYSRGPYSPGFEFEDDSHSRYLSDHGRSKIHYERGEMEDSEVLRNEFRRPRDILLSLVADFHSKCTARLAEINKKTGYDGKTVEILDVKSHLRLVDIAHSLLKVAPYDPDTMGCRGLQRYINDILPSTEWSNDAMRPALITILRRLDKTFNKIYKKASIRRHTDWDAAAGLLKGIYETLARCPYIVHMQHLKTLINTCQSLILGDASNFDVSANEPLVVRILMSMVPPPHFCSTVVRLIVIQILLMGESYSLEQVCGSSVFPNKKKTESMLMNLIIPLCMRVGSGRRDVPRMRQQDISFALTVVLHAMCPPATLTAQNIKSLSEMRSGSLAVGKETKKPVRLPQSTYQVSFLALKIIMVCFESELTNDWHRIAKTVKDVGRILDLGTVFWNFLDFVASQRTPLFVLLLAFINQKVNSPPINDQQRHMQFIIREKLKGYSLPVTKCRSALLIDLAHEIKELKEELENGKIEDARGGDQLNTSNSQSQDISAMGHVRHHRPSLIGGLFSGAGDLTTRTNQFASDIQLKLVRSQRNSVSSVSERKQEEAAAADENSSTTAKGSGSKENSESQKKPSVKLRFTSNVEMKDDSGETSITPLSPASPNEDSSGEAGKYNKPRLQRSKAQSRKTFRLRKSRKSRMGNIDTSNIKIEKQSYSTPATPTQITPQAQKLLLEQLKEAKLKELLPKEEEGKRRGSASASDKGSVSSDQAPPTPADRKEAPPSASQPHQAAGYRNSNLLKADLSVDDDTSAVSQTSSTSGYRESCSFITMTMESPILQRPSPIPATTSPESSLTSIDGDETAVLARSSSSQHSLMMLFETQDEDTLI